MMDMTDMMDILKFAYIKNKKKLKNQIYKKNNFYIMNFKKTHHIRHIALLFIF